LFHREVVTNTQKAKTVKAFANTGFVVGMKAAAKPDTSVVRPRGGCKLGCVKTALERVISLITIES
jgi:hypothetical protein